jgi:hypothetical protein
MVITKDNLRTLLELADLARSTGKIGFEAMATVADAVTNATQVHNALAPGQVLMIVEVSSKPNATQVELPEQEDEAPGSNAPK